MPLSPDARRLFYTVYGDDNHPFSLVLRTCISAWPEISFTICAAGTEKTCGKTQNRRRGSDNEQSHKSWHRRKLLTGKNCRPSHGRAACVVCVCRAVNHRRLHLAQQQRATVHGEGECTATADGKKNNPSEMATTFVFRTHLRNSLWLSQFTLIAS